MKSAITSESVAPAVARWQHLWTAMPVVSYHRGKVLWQD